MDGAGDNKSRRQHKSGGDLSPTRQRQRVKQDVCNLVLKHLKEEGNEAVNAAGFEEELQQHFTRLPTRYALDVNVERAEDVLTHKRLLHLAQSPENRPAFHVRAVHVLPVRTDEEKELSQNAIPMEEETDTPSRSLSKFQVHPPPAFGSTPNLEALALDLQLGAEDEDTSLQSGLPPHMPMHEVTFSTIDKPKLLSRLSTLLADVGLNIREAHVFSTVDGYSLDVFIVDGWPTEETDELVESLQAALSRIEKGAWSKISPLASPLDQSKSSPAEPAKKDSDSCDDWEIDSSQLILQRKVAAGSFGDLYRGTYCGQDVAIKILKGERLNENLQQEFKQEVSIMRKVRHKNVVQFIGACTKPPNMSIVTEFMAGGSIYDFLHKQKGTMKLSMMLRAAIDVSKGMDYLHQNNIIHRDLKAANLLMDENEVVKIADFGVARVQSSRGIMTAETGTYRWMAPEVIEHKPYDRKVDVFSFGIVLWELLTGKVPYADLTPLQAAVGVVQKGLRPTIPKATPPKLAELMERCWNSDPARRPDFSEITVQLMEILQEVNEEGVKDRKSGGFLSSLKRSSGGSRQA